MIKSMTGYGKAVAEIPGRKYTFEVRSLNSKQSDVNLKIPGTLREKEIEIRNILLQRLERGKIDLFISTEATGEILNYSVNKELAKKYYTELKNLQVEFGEEELAGLLPLVLKMPEVIQSGEEEPGENEWGTIRSGISSAIEKLDAFRIHEGKILEEDLRFRTGLILTHLESIEPFEKDRITGLREKMARDFENFGKSNGLTVSPDKNRFEEELIYYLEKMDITEEKVRLKKHCDYFLVTMDEPVSQGKKLGFITQEMGREINTLGSKAYDANIQKIVVQMKDELEKIKEQLGNIL
jgi:uncharacterized protein (TIGR00255 family)